MNTNLKSCETASHPQNLILACGYLLGLLVLPVAIALCGEFCLNRYSPLVVEQRSDLLVERSSDLQPTLTYSPSLAQAGQRLPCLKRFGRIRSFPFPRFRDNPIVGAQLKLPKLGLMPIVSHWPTPGEFVAKLGTHCC